MIPERLQQRFQPTVPLAPEQAFATRPTQQRVQHPVELDQLPGPAEPEPLPPRTSGSADFTDLLEQLADLNHLQRVWLAGAIFRSR